MILSQHLCDISYDYANKGLILVFTERSHFETNNFHLAMGIVPLDDVLSLLHLPIKWENYVQLTHWNLKKLNFVIVELLGVDHTMVGVKMTQARGSKVRSSWLTNVYNECCEQ